MPAALDALYLPPLLREMTIRSDMWLFEDFSSGAITTGLVVTDVSAAGSPVSGVVSDAGGQFDAFPDAQNETQAVGFSQNGVLTWPIGWGVVFAARFRVITLPAAAGSIVLCGLATARNATPDSVTEHIWFRIEANGNLLIEKDDNQSGGDVDDQDTLLDVVANQYCTVIIDCRQRSRIAFYAAIDANDELTRVLPGTQFNFSASGTGLFQILCEVQKTDAARPRVKWDWAGVWAQRALDTQSTVYPAVTL